MILLRCFDLIGICIMICGSTTAPFYYGFMCEENQWGFIYLAQVWTFCIIATILTLTYRNRPDKKWIGAIAYIVAGYSTGPGMLQLAWHTPEATMRYF